MKVQKGTVVGTSSFVSKKSGVKYLNIYVTIEQPQDADHVGLVASHILVEASDIPSDLKLGSKLPCIYTSNGYRLIEGL